MSKERRVLIEIRHNCGEKSAAALCALFVDGVRLLPLGTISVEKRTNKLKVHGMGYCGRLVDYRVNGRTVCPAICLMILMQLPQA